MNANSSNRATARLRRHTSSETSTVYNTMHHFPFESTMETFSCPLRSTSASGHQVSNEGRNLCVGSYLTVPDKGFMHYCLAKDGHFARQATR